MIESQHFEYWSMCYYKQLVGLYDNLLCIRACKLSKYDVDEFIEICSYAYHLSSTRIPHDVAKCAEENEILFAKRFGKWTTTHDNNGNYS